MVHRIPVVCLGVALLLALNVVRCSSANQPKDESWQRVTVLRESDYEKYRFFFLDSVYLVQYLKKRAGAQDTLDVPAVTDIQLWLMVDPSEIQSDTSGTYRCAPYPDAATYAIFRKLERGVHYYLNESEGWIRLDSVQLDDARILGVYLRTADSTVVPGKGDTTIVRVSIGGRDVMKSLWILKDATPHPNQPSFYLAWRNVYRMPRNIDPHAFAVRVKKAQGDTTLEVTPNGTPFSTILGLTDAQTGLPRLDRTDIFDQEHGYMIIPPFADSVIGNQPFRNPALGDTVPAMYVQNPAEYARDSIGHYWIQMGDRPQ
jgi:hypothetical protein